MKEKEDEVENNKSQSSAFSSRSSHAITQNSPNMSGAYTTRDYGPYPKKKRDSHFLFFFR
jgi:hypothetical protein